MSNRSWTVTVQTEAPESTAFHHLTRAETDRVTDQLRGAMTGFSDKALLFEYNGRVTYIAASKVVTFYVTEDRPF